ncbi:MAG TPA: hypothetical protein VN374_07200, partial [Desulfitobacteriaceae bacterium]|nr:hypothetical protein [Desulfitobacteriaceae bacterium]
LFCPFLAVSIGHTSIYSIKRYDFLQERIIGQRVQTPESKTLIGNYLIADSPVCSINFLFDL